MYCYHSNIGSHTLGTGFFVQGHTEIFPLVYQLYAVKEQVSAAPDRHR